MFAEIALDLPVRGCFHYEIPISLAGSAAVGKRVRVPFGPRKLQGYIVALSATSPVAKTKPIDSIIDENPILTEELLALTRWVAETYQAGWGETIAAALPGLLRRGKRDGKPRFEQEEETAESTLPMIFTAEQKTAFEPIREAIRSGNGGAFLLHGVTGSGKTEIYLQAIDEVLAKKQGSIVLVPEISLTPQAIERFRGRFGADAVAVIHSGMLDTQRYQEWRRIQSGEARIVVGARSAIFAPVENLGLIVIDEEHEPSYKQDDAPRYHAREVALRRGQINHATVILGSATPALETYYAATQPNPAIRLLELTERVEEQALPEVQVVDMKSDSAHHSRSRIFSRPLEDAIAQALETGQQGILFLNRRGFSTFIHCRQCGAAARCPSCQTALTYHMAEKKLLCHSCHTTHEAGIACGECKGPYIKFQGTGTERVESELARVFPQARVARMDTDATKLRGTHAKILNEFKAHKIDLLVGTQMIAKGLDFPKVTVVGVISADTALNLPDFRAAERTFCLLTQVAGRAGRGKLPGRVIVQTYAPHHYAIQAARQHDYASFYKQEIAIRRQLKLPPFTRLVELTVRSMQENQASVWAAQLADQLRRGLPPEIQVLGPAPAPIPKLRRQYRWHLILKAPTLDWHLNHLPAVLEKIRAPKGCRLAVDVDPL